MPDNINVTPGSGATIAADLISSVLHQRVKVEYGADGSATDVDATHPLPVGSGDSDDAAPAGGLMPIAGIYQSTVDEVDAGDVGRLRMSQRRVLFNAADYKSLICVEATPVPTGSDLIDGGGNPLEAVDFAIRDTTPHGFAIPLAMRGWRDIAIGLSQPSSFDQNATITLYTWLGSSGGNTFSTILTFTWQPGHTISITARANGQGGTTGGATSSMYANYAVAAIQGPYLYSYLVIQFAIAPTTGTLQLVVDRST
jgi:hypothetical protein